MKDVKQTSQSYLSSTEEYFKKRLVEAGIPYFEGKCYDMEIESEDSFKGAGNFAEVYNVKHEGKDVAMKLFDMGSYKAESSVDLVLKEIISLDSCNKLGIKFIPKFYGVTFCSVNKTKKFGLLTELINGQNLDEYLSNLPCPMRKCEVICGKGKGKCNGSCMIKCEEECSNTCKKEMIQILLKLTTILEPLQAKRIIHRDIKPENIMISGEDVYLIDFGVSRINESTMEKTAGGKGTPRYAAPENWSNDAVVTVKFDIWSFGCVIVELITGMKPWKELNSEDKIIKAIMKTDNSNPFPFEINDLDRKLENFPDIMLLLSSIFDYEESNRPTPSEIKSILGEELSKFE